jgi:uncharacterized protein (TIGR04255 family)
MTENDLLPDYNIPPINEVVIGVQFSDIKDFKLHHISDIYDIIGREIYSDYKELPPLPKINFSNKDTITLQLSDNSEAPRFFLIVQFQKDRLLCNWRKSQKSMSYCRYDKIEHNFFELYNSLRKKLKELGYSHVMQPEILELHYVNIIPYNNPDDLSNLLEGITWNVKGDGKNLPAPSEFNMHWRYILDENHAIMSIRAVTLQDKANGDDVLRLDIYTQGQIDCESDECFEAKMKQWYDTSHKWIVKAFDEITHPEMHKKWGKI